MNIFNLQPFDNRIYSDSRVLPGVTYQLESINYLTLGRKGRWNVGDLIELESNTLCKTALFNKKTGTWIDSAKMKEMNIVLTLFEK